MGAQIEEDEMGRANITHVIYENYMQDVTLKT